MAKTSGGVEASLVSQNGQNVVSLANLLKWKSEGRTAVVSAMITHRPVNTSLRIWDTCVSAALWIPLTGLFVRPRHFSLGYSFESCNGPQQPFSKSRLNLLVCTRAVQSV